MRYHFWLLWGVLLLVSGSLALSQPVIEWKRTKGPYGGTGLDLAIDSAGVVYTATFKDGLYRSLDGGDTWENVPRGIVNDQIERIVATRQNLFAATASKVFRLESDGRSWTDVSEGLGGVELLRLTASSGGDLFAGTSQGVFRLNRDQAEPKWVRLGHSSVHVRVNDVVLGSSGVLFAAFEGSGIMRSTDDGITWTLLFEQQAGSYWPRLLHSDRNGVVHVAGATLMHSTDNGETWISALTPPPPDVIETVTADADGTMYIAMTGNMQAGSGVYRSTDRGATWNQISTVPVTIMEAGAGGMLFAWAGDLYRSTDRGTTWGRSHRFIANSDVKDVMINDDDVIVARIPPKEPGVLFTHSLDGGLTWSEVKSDLSSPESRVYYIDYRGYIYSSDRTQFHISRDFGATWQGSPLPQGNIYNTLVDHEHRIFIVAGNNRDALYRSSDDAATWTKLDNALESGQKIAEISGGYGVMVLLLNDGSLLRSRDGGDTWMKLPALDGEPGIGAPVDVAVSPSGDVIGITGKDVIRYTDLVAHLIFRGDDRPLKHVVVSANGGIVVGSETQVLVSRDNGGEWDVVDIQPDTNMFPASIKSMAMNRHGDIVVGTPYHGVLHGTMDVNSADAPGSGGGVAATPLIAICPNPASSRLRISYTLPEKTFITLDLCNVYGDVISNLVREYRPAGDYHTGADLQHLPNGTYYTRLRCGDKAPVTIPVVIAR